MKTKRWPDEPAQITPLVSLDTYYRNLRHQDVQDAQDEGVAIGFFYGVATAAFVWSILSGLLAAVCYQLAVVLVFVYSQLGGR